MTSPRIHIPADRWSRRLVLMDSERRHLVSVLRLQPGDRVEVFDGQGHGCTGNLLHEGRSWLLSLGPREFRPDNLPDVRLGVARLKGKKLDSVVRMVTEVGVASIWPFSCARTVPKTDVRRMQERINRFATIASEGARQSCRSFIPTVHPLQTLEEILSGNLPPFCAVLHESADGRTLSDLLFDAGPERLLLVGPEGGFAPEEIEMARQKGFHVARLGLPVLRAETAAVVAAALACLGPRPGPDPPPRFATPRRSTEVDARRGEPRLRSTSAQLLDLQNDLASREKKGGRSWPGPNG